jgi:Pirin
MIEIRRAAERGVAEHGWLSSRHTFSFGNYHDAEQVGFSDLLVINADHVLGGRGFGLHPHRDMEIFSYVLDQRGVMTFSSPLQELLSTLHVQRVEAFRVALQHASQQGRGLAPPVLARPTSSKARSRTQFPRKCF